MDYCHPCRRHLNGALACPGCGTPVETLRAHPEASAAPQAAYEEDVPEPEPEPHAEPEPAEGTRQSAAADAPTGPETDDGGPGAGVSRRDRKAAAHRRRRRRSLLIAAGFVLAAGALSLAELGMDAPGSKPEPAAATDETPNGGSAKVGSAPPPSGAPGAGASVDSPSPSASGSPSASKSPTDEESAEAEEGTEAEGEAGGEPGEATRPAPAGTAPADPTAAPPRQSPPQPDAPEPAPTTTEPEPEPEPEPSETCDRFLWWCT
ncbi:hypothetical protein ACFWOL_08760 [Streptomyces sp. NPDC058442]|uniref:SCO2400 family protein n=1 Tax=Streptomyces sp. NPDC058442 TaxID=3346503 RepID=UPI003650E42C